MYKAPLTWIAMMIVVAIGTLVIFLTTMRPISFESTIDLTKLRLERATTNAERQLGLGGRQSLDENAGMLFLFDTSSIHPFWMKGMHFPIDIIWINGDRVVDVVTLPPPSYEDAIPASHTPLHLADTILELNAGQAKKLGIVKGVRLILPKD